jgi:hypothetical protein
MGTRANDLGSRAAVGYPNWLVVSIVEPFLTVPYSGSSTGSRPFIKETARDMRDGKSFLCDPQRKTG